MTDLDAVVETIGTDLLSAIGNHQRRTRRRLRALAAGAVAAAAATLLLAVTGGDGASPTSALAVTRTDRAITVRVEDASADAERMTAQLRAVGANAVVQAEPVSPPAVGHWLASGTVGPATAQESSALAQDLGAQIRQHPEYISIDTATPYRILLVVGRPAPSGEQPCAGTGSHVVVPLDGATCAGPTSR